MRLRALAGVASAAGLTAVLSGCSILSPAAVPAPATPTPATTSASPASAAPPKVVVPRVTAPALPTGSAWKSVVPQLLAYSQWVLATGSVTGEAVVAAPGCSFDDALSGLVQQERGAEMFLRPQPISVLATTTPSTVSSSEIDLTVEVSRASENFTDPTGKVQLQSQVALPPSTFDLTLDRGADGHWRICSAANGQQSSLIATTPPPVDQEPDGEQMTGIL